VKYEDDDAAKDQDPNDDKSREKRKKQVHAGNGSGNSCGNAKSTDRANSAGKAGMNQPGVR